MELRTHRGSRESYQNAQTADVRQSEPAPAAQASPAHRQPLKAYGPMPPAYERRRRPRPGAAVCSCLGAVAQVHHAVAEPALVQQFELEPGPVGEELLAAAQHDGPDEQVVLLHQPGGDRMGAEGGTAHGEITLGCRLQVPDRFGVEVWFDPGPGGGGRRQRPGVHDLVGRLPDLRELPRAGRLGRGGGVGLPDLHQLVQPASVQVGADRPQQVVDEGVVLLAWCPPVELAVLVGDVAVKGRIHHIEQLGHGEPSSRVGAARPSVSTLPRGCVTARQPSPTLSEHRSCPSPDMSQIPLLNAWPGGLLCPWTRGTVDAVACLKAPGASDRANEVGYGSGGRPWVASGTGLVGGALAAGGRACQEPSGQIPPPWSWWENEAPTTRTARCPSQVATPSLARPGGVPPLGSPWSAPGEQLREVRVEHAELVAPGIAQDPEVKAALLLVVIAGRAQGFQASDLGLDVVGLQVQVHSFLGDLLEHVEKVLTVLPTTPTGYR